MSLACKRLDRVAEGLDHDGEDIPPVLFASVILLDRARCLPASYVSLIICAYSPHGTEAILVVAFFDKAAVLLLTC